MSIAKYKQLVVKVDAFISAFGELELPVGEISEAKIDGFELTLVGDMKDGKLFKFLDIYSPEVNLGSSLSLVVNYIRAMGKALNEKWVYVPGEKDLDMTKSDFKRELDERLVDEDTIIRLILNEDTIFQLKPDENRYQMAFEFRRVEGNYTVSFHATTAPISSVDRFQWYARDILTIASEFLHEDHKKYFRRATIQTELEEYITKHPTQITRMYLG